MKTNLVPAYIKHSTNKPAHLQYVAAMKKIVNPEGYTPAYIKDTQLPRQPRIFKERPNARHPHKQEEKKLQKDIIDHLRLHGCTCGKVKAEAGVYRGIRLKSNLLFLGVPDILVFHSLTGLTFIEVKTATGRMRPEQIIFKELCEKANIKHIVCRCIKDVEVIYAPPVFD